MRRAFASLLVVLAVAIGALTVTAGSASASCPYSACIHTTTTLTTPHKVRSGQRAILKVSTTAPGNLTPYGTIEVRITRHGAVTSDVRVPYAGGSVAVATKKLHKGRYVVSAVFTPVASSVLTGSSDSRPLVVKRDRRR